MQVVRYPSPARAMVVRRLQVGLPLFVGGFAAVLGASVVGYYVMLAGIAAMALGIPVLGGAFNAWLGNRGEEAVDRALAGLDDRYTLRCNYCPDGQVGDADRIVDGPHGTLLIEVKTYTRPIRVRGETWFVQLSSGRWKRIKSPFSQAKRCAKALAKECGHRVTSIVAIPNGVPLDAIDPTLPIVRFKDLAAYIAGLPQITAKAA